MNDIKLLKEMQLKQLEMLKELDRVCNILKIKYYLSSGTCLGAVRHQGFIPWDDDIDVYMYYKHAELLQKNMNLFKKQYFVQCKETDKNVKTTHYRLRDSSTSIFFENEREDINHGIFIDIYILYPFPDNKFLAKKVIFDSYIYRILVANEGPRNHGQLVRIIGDVIAHLYRGEYRNRKIKKIEQEYKKNGGKTYLATYFGRDTYGLNAIKYPRVWFEHPKKLKFEDMEVNCPANYKKYCELQYGANYMELPPETERVPHHDYTFCSVSEPYTYFKGIYYDKK